MEHIQDSIRQELKEANLLTSEEVSVLKMKVQKNHLTEKDWRVLNQLLVGRGVITIAPENPSLKKRTEVEGLFFNAGYLMAFSNAEDCSAYLNWFNLVRAGEEKFAIGALSFEKAADIADRRKIPLAIDLNPGQRTRFLCYRNQSLEVMSFD